MKKTSFLLFILFNVIISCSSSSNGNDSNPKDDNTDDEVIVPPVDDFFYYGADLSYVNEMEDCGATYIDANDVTKDPFTIFSDAGTNIVRVRLWHNPTWTDYSNYEDVKKTIQRAKTNGMKVLLDFHYSDDWTDPSKQEIPAAWLSEINNTEALGDLLYSRTKAGNTKVQSNHNP